MNGSLCSLPSNQRVYQATVEREIAACERSFYAFVRFAWPHVDDSPFVDGWHIKAICDHLQAVQDVRIKNLLINVPPGCGKSILVSVLWPVWCWIKKPSSRFMCASYSADLSTRDAVKARYLIASAWFQLRWGRLFAFASDQNMKTKYENDKKGWRIATSVGGRITGEHPDFVVVDDPHNATEALSDAKREEVVEWWNGAMSTRGVARGVRKVVIMQRLHEEDLSGVILKAGDFEHICLPMRFEKDRMPTTSIGWNDPRKVEGELMFPEVFPEKAVKGMELNLARRAAGQLQQRPTPADGDVFRKSWFKYYRIENDLIRCRGGGSYRLKDCWIFATVDLAVSEDQDADYTVIKVFAVAKDSSTFLLARHRERMIAPKIVPALKATARRWKCDWIGIEAVAFQLAIVQQARREGLTVKKLTPKGDKVARANSATGRMEAGMVYFPEEAEWLTELENELLAFPNGKHDDQVDALVYGLIEIGRVCGAIDVPEEVAA